jgi:hypothetical protein
MLKAKHEVLERERADAVEVKDISLALDVIWIAGYLWSWRKKECCNANSV